MDTVFKPITEPRIVFDEGGVIVAAKPAGMHCAPAGETGTLCSWLFARRPEAALVGGRCNGEGGLLHRLDAATSGLVAFASDEDAFASMLASGKTGNFQKCYRALGTPSVTGLLGSKPESMAPPGADVALWRASLRRADAGRLADMLSGISISSRFRPYGPGAVRVACAATEADQVINDGKGGKAWTRDTYRTEIGTARPFHGGVLAEARLVRGFRHQIRAHMAWLGLPLEGDSVYGDGAGGPLRLRAFRLSFPAPRGGGLVEVDLDTIDLDAC